MNRSVRAPLAFLALAVLTSCRPDPVFTCSEDEDCAGASTPGRCESSGQCSFADTTCASGRRYGDHAREMFEGVCVAVNLLPNPTFETGIGGWTGHESQLSLSDNARTGAQAALVCANSGATFFTLADAPASVQDASPGTMYTASVWVRLAPGSSAQLVKLAIDERADTGVDGNSAMISLDDAWQLLEVAHVVEVAGPVGIVVRSTARDPGGCFLADDATFSP